LHHRLRAVELGLLCGGIAAFDPFLIQFAHKVGRGAVNHALHQVAVADPSSLRVECSAMDKKQ
jgi:hypothetical protein